PYQAQKTAYSSGSTSRPVYRPVRPSPEWESNPRPTHYEFGYDRVRACRDVLSAGVLSLRWSGPYRCVRRVSARSADKMADTHRRRDAPGGPVEAVPDESDSPV